MTRTRLKGRWLRRAGAALLAWVFLAYLSRALGGDADVGLVGLVVAAAGAVLWVGLDAVAERGSTSWDLQADEPVGPPGQDLRLAALNRLVAGHLRGRRTDDALPRQLARLADQRLVARYGVSWRADPGRARPLLGPDLAALVEGSQRGDTPRLTTRQLDELLARIEEL